MLFGIGINTEEANSGEIKGVQREIACDCWFTAQGRTMPRIIKYKDEEGIIHTINEIQIMFSEEKRYSGIETIEHICKMNIAGRERTVKLIFTKENCKWSIVV